MTPRELAVARGVCRVCPVRTECLGEALVTDDEWGIWGGFTRPERQRIVARFAPTNSTDRRSNAQRGAAALPGAIAALSGGLLETLVIVL